VSTPTRIPTLRAVPASPIAGTRHRPLPIPSVRLVGGPLAAWQQRNVEATIPHCIEQLEVSGVLDNFRRLLGESDAEFRGLVFADSDLYKVIEAVAWEIARTRTRAFDSWLDDVIALVARVQEPSGYVHTWIQGVAPEKNAPFDVDDLAVLPASITVGERDTLVLRCGVIKAADGLYGPDTATATELGDEHAVTAIPFSTWGNRDPGPMRVWLPRAPC
jgi:DUF1680 family protein